MEIVLWKILYRVYIKIWMRESLLRPLGSNTMIRNNNDSCIVIDIIFLQFLKPSSQHQQCKSVFSIMRKIWMGKGILKHWLTRVIPHDLMSHIICQNYQGIIRSIKICNIRQGVQSREPVPASVWVYSLKIKICSSIIHYRTDSNGCTPESRYP